MSVPLSLLLVEDSEDDAILVAHALRRGGYDLTFERVDTPEAMCAALARQCWDIVISDFAMPQFSGPAALAQLKESGLDLPFIIVSGHIGEEVAVAAMKAGAHDYVMKDNLVRLAPAVGRELREVEVRRARRQAREALCGKTRQQAQLLKTARYLTESLDVTEVLTRIGIKARELLGSFGCSIYLLEPDGKTLTPVVAIDPSYEEQILATPLSVETSLTGQAVKARCGLVFNDALASPFGHQIPGTPVEEDERLIVAPFCADAQVLGAMCLNRTGMPFSDEDLALVETFATYAATALKNAQTCDALQREVEQRVRAEQVLRQRNRELNLLNRASRALSSILDLDQVLLTVLDEVRCLLNVIATSVWLVDSETDELVCRQAVGPNGETVRNWRMSSGEGLAGWVARNGESLIVPDARADPRHFADVDRQTGMALRSVLSVPLRARRDVIGVLQVLDTEVDRFQASDLTLTEPLAATAAIAIENARLYAEEQQRAMALAQALAQQRDLDRLKDQFIQNVSHELRTPLGLILGYAELLDGGALGKLAPDQREPVTIIVRRARMLTKMMSDLTAILETESQQPRREWVDLADMVEKLVADVRATTEQAGLTLTAQVAPNLPLVYTDPTHLSRVFDNLLSNALKFTPVGGCIDVRLAQEDEHVVLEVADTGVGIPEDQLERIFERFYQVDGSASRRYGGTGLGLALVKEIVEAHGGTVKVRSDLGKGSTFRVTLPSG